MEAHYTIGLVGVPCGIAGVRRLSAYHSMRLHRNGRRSMRTLGLSILRSCVAIGFAAAAAAPSLAQGEPITAPLQSFIADIGAIEVP